MGFLNCGAFVLRVVVFVVVPVGGILEGYFRVAAPEAPRAALEAEEPILVDCDGGCGFFLKLWNGRVPIGVVNYEVIIYY